MFRRKLVKNAHANNTLQIAAGESGCCGQSASLCKYRVEYTDYTTLTLITVEEDGKNVAIAVDASGAGSDAEFFAIVRAALVGAGYIIDDQPRSEPKDVTLFTDNAGDTFIEFWGDAKIVSLGIDAGTATATEMCTSFAECFYSVVTTVGEATTVSVDGDTPEALGTHATGDGADLKAAIIASDALGDAHTVTVTEADGEFTITFYFETAEVVFADVTQGDVLATRSGCKQQFKA